MTSRITPAMSDGRSFTNYVSSGIYNTYLEDKFAIPNDTEYRKYLQTNAEKVMKYTNTLRADFVPPVWAQGPVRPLSSFKPAR